MGELNRVLVWMLIFLAAVIAICSLLIQPLQRAFLANQVFNGMILGVLFIGIVINLRQVISLRPELKWIRVFRKGSSGRSKKAEPRLLATMARLFSGRDQQGFRMSAMTMRSLLDGIRLRLDESRDLSRYMIGLLIFLGLLGTFWGLLDTVVGVSDVISGLSMRQGEDPNKTFDLLKMNLQQPLGGMGTAFSSSLFGLAGALVVGFLDLQAGHAQNRFYNRLEEWLSELTHLPSGSLSVEGEGTLPSYIEALLEQTADGLHKLQRAMSRIEEDRRVTQSKVVELTEKLADLTDQMRSEQKLIISLTKNQMDLQPAIAQLVERASGGWAGDEEMRDHLRSVDVGITRLVNEFPSDQKELLDDLRNEIRLLTRTLAQRTKQEG